LCEITGNWVASTTDIKLVVPDLRRRNHGGFFAGELDSGCVRYFPCSTSRRRCLTIR
jgi:hypothetical protein